MFVTRRKPLSIMVMLAMLATFLPWGMGHVHASAPAKVLKVTEEVKPGETISIYGENLSSALHTHVYLVENGNLDLPIEQYDPAGHVIRVILPSNVPAGAYTLHVQNDDGSVSVYVNKAAPKWISDKAAYAGMRLKLMGRNLDAAKFGNVTNTQIRFVPAAGGAAVGAAVNSVTPFDVTFTTPSSGLTNGAGYYIEVNTNAGTTSAGTAWVRLKDDNGSDFQLLYKGSAPADALALSLGVSWSKDFNWGQVKNVKTDFGASGNGSTDDLNAIQSGINWLNANGGGVLYFPSGTYAYNGILTNKTGVVLKGENRDTTILRHTGPSNLAINAPGQSLMGIANLKLTLDESAIPSDDGFTFIADYGDAWGTTEPNLHSDRMFFYNVWTDNSLSSNKVHVHYIVGGKENVLWANNKLYGRGGVIYSVWLRQYVTVRDNTFDYSLWYNDFSASKALFLNNTITGHDVPGVSEDPVGIHGFANNPAQGWPLKDLYFDNNTISNMGQADATGNVDGELITAEPPNGQLTMGAVTSASSNTATFSKDYVVSGANWNQSWQALIVQGTGIGQLRNVTNLTDNGGTATATLDRSWDVQPDTTSKVVIRRMVEDMVIARTDGSNSTWALVFYNVVYDGVIADNTLSHTQGAQSVGYVNADNLVAPTYFNQLKRNSTIGKSTGPSQFAAQGAECTWIGAPIEELDAFDPGTGYYAISNYATEIKDNTVDRYDCSNVADWATWKYGAAVPLNNRNYDSSLPMTGIGTLGAMVENNVLRNSDYGIFLGKNAGTTFIKGNSYQNITTGNIVDDGSTNTVIYSGSSSPPPPPSNNLALGITPTSSDGTATSLSAITDGVSSDTESYVGLASGAQWIKIDLGQSYDLSKINVWHYYGDGRTYHDVIMQVSNDPNFATGVTTVFNNDADNSAGQGTGSDAEYAETSSGKSATFSAVNARYVRLWSNGSSANGFNHYVEVEVYGVSSAAPANKALGITPTSSDSTAGSLTAITDGSSSDTEAYVGLASGAQWIKIDLGQSYDLSKINVWHYYGDGRTYHGVILQVSNDPNFSSGVTTVFNNDTDNSAGQGAGSEAEYAETSGGKSVTFSAVNARYVRLWSNGSSANGFNHYVEVEVYGN